MPLVKATHCTFKRPYSSESEALKVVKEIRKAGRMRRFCSFNAYKCFFCEYWHVGHKSRPRDQRPA